MIFSAKRTAGDNGYGETAQKMVSLAMSMPGYLGIESSRDDSLGITVSYWATEADNKRWYEHYELRIAKVERAYSGPVGR